MVYKNYILLAIGLFTFMSCEKLLLQNEEENNPVTNFESVWNEFDEKYGLFETKQIDWDAVYQHYRPQINTESTEQALYLVLKEMLTGLHDNHVGLVTTNPNLPGFTSGSLANLTTITDFDLSIITENYLEDARFEDPFFTYGILPDNIGYIHIEGFSDLPRFLENPLDNVLTHLKDTKGIIIDVRGGYGGEDLAGQYIASRFTAEKKPYMTTRIKNGPSKNDFTNPETWYIQSEGDFQYLNPVIILTHRFTISARETFCLAMRVLPEVTFVGDTTAGAFSNQINREMPNGWGFSLSIGEWKTAEGISYEGTGLPPDIVIQNASTVLQNGEDTALETAMSLLN